MMQDLLTVALGVLALVAVFGVAILVAFGFEAFKFSRDPEVKAARERRREWDRTARRDS